MSDVSDQQGSGLPKTFDPAAIEAKWYAHWEANGLFRPERPDAEPFTIVNPPPNVTGSLHIGHALDNTLQDVVVRYERLRGRDALWVVGTDHAGIATQMVVERNLAAEGLKRADLGREAFLDKVWEWKGTSGGAITRQLRRLGCSMDWSREQFTMDPHFTRAVVHVFVALHRRGLIYRAKRLVNWDPVFRSAISDLEVESREVSGHMWHFKYPLEGGRTYRYVERDADGAVLVDEMRDYISIATTRPETMLGDGAVAVHPDDERYRELVGTRCEIPVGPKEQRRLIPIIADDYPDPAFGSGAVKITGAHDANDYGVAQRHGIPMYRLMDEAAAMRADGPSYAEGSARARAIAAGEAATPAEIDSLNLVPESYRGLDRYEARRRVVADIDADGLLIRVEDKPIMQPFGDRSNVVIEPMLTDQWYVDAEKLAAPAIEAVRSGAVEIVPKSWEKTFFNWMENIQPWCVSRQLWWGHRIPVWYGPPLDADGNISFVGDIGQGIPFVAETAGEAVELARAFYAVDLPIAASDDAGAWVADNKARYLRMAAGEDPEFAITLVRDPDVLDTWFSSALWPFATLGWPETDAPLATRHYPNDLLISGFDILFFWDARMLMQGIEFLGTPPWKRLYLHGLVRAADGQKMSKSKGNVVDPLGLIDRFGADALRFFMAAMESQGRDVKMDEARVEGYRNFATKLWNAVRFAQGNGISASDSIAAPAAKLPLNRWLIGEVAATAQAIDKAMAELRFDAAANAIYAFVWDRFCDWYLELSKPVFAEGGDAAEETRRVAGWAIDQILVMLHPFMPFITEELWHAQGTRPYELIVALWPDPQAEADPAAAAEIDWLIALIGSVRATKAELGIAPGARLTAFVPDADDGIRAMARRNGPMLDRLARLDSLSFGPPPPGAAAAMVIGGATYSLPLEGVIDVTAERARLDKALAAAVKERDSLGQRLANPAFTEKAKPEAVEKARADHAAKAAEAERLEAARGRLG